MDLTSLNVFDVGIVLVLIMSFIVGCKMGVIKEAVSLVGTILVFIIAFAFKGVIGNIMCIVFPFFRFGGVLEGLSSINILFYQLLAFVILFCLLLSIYTIIVNISKVLQKIINMTIILIPVSKLLGGLVSLIKGYIILFIVFLLLIIPLRNQDVFAKSSMVNRIVYNTPILSDSVSGITECIAEVYDLGIRASHHDITSIEANTKTVEIMLKYGIVDKETIKTLIYKNKLDNLSSQIDYILGK